MKVVFHSTRPTV